MSSSLLYGARNWNISSHQKTQIENTINVIIFLLHYLPGDKSKWQKEL